MTDELMLMVFDYLPDSDLDKCRQVCKKWLAIANDEFFLASRTPPPPEACGQKAWETIGKVTNIRRLPSRIRQILDSPCPIWQGEPIKDTHILFWLPTTVNGQAHTINNIGTLVPMPGKKSGYSYIWGLVKIKLGNEPNPTGKWLLMTKTTLPGTDEEKMDIVMEKIKELNEKAKTDYRMFTPLEAITGCFLEFKRSGSRLYSYMFTRCSTIVGGYRIYVGSTFDGLDVGDSHTTSGSGVGVLREI